MNEAQNPQTVFWHSLGILLILIGNSYKKQLSQGLSTLRFGRCLTSATGTWQPSEARVLRRIGNDGIYSYLVSHLIHAYLNTSLPLGRLEQYSDWLIARPFKGIRFARVLAD